MTETTEVEIIGEGTHNDPYRPDYDGDYEKSQYDWDSGTVTIQIPG